MQDVQTVSGSSYTISFWLANEGASPGGMGNNALALAEVASLSTPTNLVLATASDSGTHGDNITNVVRPTITGTADVGQAINVLVDGTVVGSTTSNAGGTWSYTFTTSLVSGQHAITATETGGGGSTAASTALAITIETSAAAPSGLTLAPASDSGTTGDNITNITTPVITGSGVVGDTITLHDGSTQIGTGTVAIGGAWSITSTALVAGSHTLTATQTDVAANVSTASGSLVLTIDTASPTAPSALTLAPASDSGTTGDNITNITTPVITGSGVVGDTITLYDGSTQIGTGTVAIGSAWSVTSTALVAGSHTLTATQTDMAANISTASGSLVLTIDTASPAPSALTLAPASDSGTTGDNITNITTPVITGSGVVGDTVKLYNGSTLVGTGTVAIGGAWSITSTALVAGSHTLTATQTDVAANVSTASSSLVLTIDTASPAPSALTLAPASDSGTTGDNITNVTTPVITGSGVVGDTITLYDGSTQIGTGTVAPGGTWSVTSTALVAGSHTLTATQTDVAANVSTASGSLVLTIDTASPAPSALTLAPASDSGTTGDNITNITTPVITGSGVVGDTITLYDGSTQIGTGTVAPGGTWSVTSTALIDGIHSLSATQTDVAANVSAASNSLALTVVTSAPAPAGLTLAPGSDSATLGDDITNVATPVITGTGGAGDSIALYDGATQVGGATVQVDGTWSVTASTLVDGSHTLTATQTDGAANLSAASGSLVLDIKTFAAPPSSLTLSPASDSGTTGDDVTNINAPTITGTGAVGDTISLYDGAIQIGVGTVDSGGNWSVATVPLADGGHTLTATQTDLAGNVSAASDDLALIIDTAVPGPPTLADTHQDNDPSRPVLSGTGVAGNNVTLLLDGVALGTAAVSAAGYWAFGVPSALAAGTYSLTATQSDQAGNTSAATAPLSIVVGGGGGYTVAYTTTGHHQPGLQQHRELVGDHHHRQRRPPAEIHRQQFGAAQYLRQRRQPDRNDHPAQHFAQRPAGFQHQSAISFQHGRQQHRGQRDQIAVGEHCSFDKRQ